MSMAIVKKTSIDEQSFVQFIIALRQIKASSRAAGGDVNHSSTKHFLTFLKVFLYFLG